MYGENVRFEDEHFGAMDFGSYGLGASVTPVGSQLVNANTAMNWGTRNLEITFATGMDFRQQGSLAQLGKMDRDELIRLAKMNRVNLNLHAPHFDAAGTTEGGFSENARQAAVREFKEVIKFADQIGTEMHVQHVPIVFHGAESTRSSPNPDQAIFYTNQETGEVRTVTAQEVTYQKEYLENKGLKEGTDFVDAHKQIGGVPVLKILPYGELKMKNQQAVEQIDAKIAHDQYWEENYRNEFNRLNKMALSATDPTDIEDIRRRIEQSAHQVKSAETERLRSEQELNHMRRLIEEKNGLLIPTDMYAKQKIIETIVDVATAAAQTKSQPKLAIENIFPEVVMGNPDFLASTIEEARAEFARRAGRPKDEGGIGISRSEASELSRDIIGINFDIGHANLWKKYGDMPVLNDKGEFTFEDGKMKTVKVNDEQIKKWSEMLLRKGLLNHVHITDNFGDYDAHMPVGFGNAPIKDIMNNLRKQGWGQKGERAIMETFGLVQYGGSGFGISSSLYGLKIPLVSGGADWEMAAGSYFNAGYPMTGFQTMPDVNYQMYGNGFSGLPYSMGSTFGGQKGEESKFSGTPMS